MNKSLLTGRISKDPSLNFSHNKIPNLRFNLAVKAPRTSSETYFIPCIAFGNDAIYISKNVSKGDLLSVVGYNKVDIIEEKDAIRYAFEVVVESVELLSKNKSNV